MGRRRGQARAGRRPSRPRRLPLVAHGSLEALVGQTDRLCDSCSEARRKSDPPRQPPGSRPPADGGRAGSLYCRDPVAARPPVLSASPAAVTEGHSCWCFLPASRGRNPTAGGIEASRKSANRRANRRSRAACLREPPSRGFTPWRCCVSALLRPTRAGYATTSRETPYSKRCAITLSMIPYCFASAAVMK